MFKQQLPSAEYAKSFTVRAFLKRACTVPTAPFRPNIAFLLPVLSFSHTLPYKITGLSVRSDRVHFKMPKKKKVLSAANLASQRALL